MEITNEKEERKKERIFFYTKKRGLYVVLYIKIVLFIFDCEEKREKIVKIKRRGIYSFDLYIDRQVFMCPSKKKSLYVEP